MQGLKTVFYRFAYSFLEFGADIFKVIDKLDVKCPAVIVVDEFGYHPADATAPLQVKEKGFQLCPALAVIGSDASQDNLIKGTAYTVLGIRRFL